MAWLHSIVEKRKLESHEAEQSSESQIVALHGDVFAETSLIGKIVHTVAHNRFGSTNKHEKESYLLFGRVIIEHCFWDA